MIDNGDMTKRMLLGLMSEYEYYKVNMLIFRLRGYTPAKSVVGSVLGPEVKP
jgi:hypothetical protein